MEEFYNKKINFLYIKYKELFKRLLINKNIVVSNNNNYLNVLAYKVRNAYPRLQKDIDKICYMFNEKNNLEEKLEYLLNTYPKIMEVLNEI